ncbi:MAG: orotidine-5'-phosphate decarboxylase [Clostridia bacterium]|nr:orotidine-5'-phosphate decarboxylase [Clostridia bacterium]
MDLLIDKIKSTNNPTVMGLDPRYEMIPEVVRKKYGTDFKSVCNAIFEYNKTLIDSVADIVPAIKPQIAFYEMFGTDGIECFKKTCKYAKEKGMLIIADVKRGDIGSTAAGYSSAYIGKTSLGNEERALYDIDFVTVNPYLGIDGVKPFIEDMKKYNKGIFVLVKTSNPSSGELQDLMLEEGITVYEKVAGLVNEWGKDMIGEYGYSAMGAVVGATYPEQLKELRTKMPNTYFLIPGYGAQGGKAEDIALGFKDSIGGIVNASRSLMCAYKKEEYKEKYSEEEYGLATREEAIKMRDELNKAINK